MRHFIRLVIVVAAVVSSGCGSSPALEGTSARSSGLTAQDVDVAPECQGILDYTNVATFAELDAWLPSNVANNIIAARAIAPFTTLAQISAVSGMGEVRLTELYGAARSASFIGASCVGIFDELAVSVDDQAAMVALVNSISSTELHDVLPYAWNGAVNLLAGRPYTSVQGISSTSGIGPVSLRNIRNSATLSRPFETLAAAVNALYADATLLRHFDWYTTLHTLGLYGFSATCFGIDPEDLPQGVTERSNLADAAEVVANVQAAVNHANRFNRLTIDPAPGIANVQSLAAGRSFFGCYIGYSNNPWSAYTRAFFVDPTSGFGVVAETGWSE